jgi:hypothetical protein
LKLNYDSKCIARNRPYYPIFLQIIRNNKQGSRDFYDISIDQKWKKPKCELRWEQELNLEVNHLWWKKQNDIFFKITDDIQLRWFHYRIVRRILATNTLLFKIGIEESDLCTFCKCNAETLGHLFWECRYVSQIWDNLAAWIKEEFDLDIPLDVLLGKNTNFIIFLM